MGSSSASELSELRRDVMLLEVCYPNFSIFGTHIEIISCSVLN